MRTRDTIINHMLTTMGEGGVSTLNSLHPSVSTAKGILESEDLDLQSRGWWFNKELSLKLTQDNEGRVAVPQTALAIFVKGIENKTSVEKSRYVKRGGYIYDVYLHTNVINTPVYVDVTLQLAIEDMPDVASSYLMHKAAEAMYVADDGDQFKTEKLERRTMEAWQRFKAQELQVLSVNAHDNQFAQGLLGRAGANYGLPGGGTR